MKITQVSTHLVGNEWKNWLLVRVDTDEGIHGTGEGSLNAFSATVASAIDELADAYLRSDPFDVELLYRRMVRDVYSDGAQVHMAAFAAIEIACWDIMGKALGQPIHRLLGGRVRDRVRVYANGWYRNERTPEAFAASAAGVHERGYTAMKFDPFGAAWRNLRRADEDLAIDIVAAVRGAVGDDVDLMIEGHNRFTVATALHLAERLLEYRPTWFEEPVPHHNIGAMVEVAHRSPVPVATGESFSSTYQFAELLSHNAVHILQPEPLFHGLWRTRSIAMMADAHYGVIAPHSAQGPVCSAISSQLGACTPNFYVQETFDEFNADWTRSIIDRPLQQQGGFVTVDDRPGLGIEVDWDALALHPYRKQYLLPLFSAGWERRSS